MRYLPSSIYYPCGNKRNRRRCFEYDRKNFRVCDTRVNTCIDSKQQTIGAADYRYKSCMGMYVCPLRLATLDEPKDRPGSWLLHMLEESAYRSPGSGETSVFLL